MGTQRCIPNGAHADPGPTEHAPTPLSTQGRNSAWHPALKRKRRRWWEHRNAALALLAAALLAVATTPLPVALAGPAAGGDTYVGHQQEGFPRMHAIITAECGAYFTWQSLGFFYSWRKIGQPGNLTRVLCCSQQDAAKDPHLDIVPTWVAPDYTYHPTNGDVYQAYNKPEAVIDWTQNANPTADYVMVIDADMIMMRVMDPELMGVKPGWAVSAHFGYMIGVQNELADKHIPEIPKRNDTLAGPKGRRSDQCGGWTFMTRDDITRVAPLWLKYTEDVRFDPDGYRLTGDVAATKPGERPWISEMYGYSYGAAKAGVWHKAHATGMMYPGTTITAEAPYTLHYGLEFEIPGTNFKFDKHWYLSFDATQCPPWDFHPGNPDLDRSRQGGLFPHPPHPSELASTGQQRYRDLHAIAVVNTLNEAFCERHYQHCPPSQQLDDECGKVHDIAEAVYQDLHFMEQRNHVGECMDVEPVDMCKRRFDSGECESNRDYVGWYCRKSCGFCKPNEWRPRPHFIAPWQRRFMDDSLQQQQQQDEQVKLGQALGRRGIGGQQDPTAREERQQQGVEGGSSDSISQQQGGSSDSIQQQGAEGGVSAGQQQQQQQGQAGGGQGGADAKLGGDSSKQGVHEEAATGAGGAGGEGVVASAKEEGLGLLGAGGKGVVEGNKGEAGTGRAGGGGGSESKAIESAGVAEVYSWRPVLLQLHGVGALVWVGLFALLAVVARGTIFGSRAQHRQQQGQRRGSRGGGDAGSLGGGWVAVVAGRRRGPRPSSP